MDRVLDEVQQRHAEAAAAQEQADQVREQHRSLIAEYRATQQQLSTLRTYNSQLEGLVRAERDKAADVQAQIDRVTGTGRELLPLMHRMVASLAAFIELDLPFLLEERRERVQGLREMLGNPGVSASEKYRRVLEAYQIELEFGRTIEAYRGTLGEGEARRTVDFLRVGRVALLYMTLDQQEVGGFDRESGRFVELGGKLVRTLPRSIRVAREQVAPELLLVPVSLPKEKP